MNPTGDFYEEEDAPSVDPSQKAPGVYVRSNDQQRRELDMLWSGSRTYGKEERSPLIFLIIGLVLGIFIAGGVFALFFNKPVATEELNDETSIVAPIVEEEELAPMADDPNQPVSNPQPKATSKPESSTNGGKKTGGSKSRVTGGKLYEVRNGDTLEVIARRHYGSGTPEMVQKIQRANNLKNPNAIYIGQKLAIPPKDY